MVTDFVISTIQYIEKNLQVEAVGAIVIIALILLAVVAVVLLVFRGAILWYWRINKQIDALEKIDKALLEIKENLFSCAYGGEEIVVLPKDTQVCESGAKVTEEEHLDENTQVDVHIEQPTETNEAELKSGTPKMFFDKREAQEVLNKKHGYNVGKDGKVYAEELLRKQIQF